MAENEVVLPGSIYEQAVHDLMNELTRYNGILVENKSNSELRDVINNNFVKICTYYFSIGQNELDLLADESSEIGEVAYLMHYRLPDLFKDLMLLHRDVLLQLQIGRQKFLEGIVSNKNLEIHSKNSQNILLESVEFFIQKLTEEKLLVARLSKKKNGIDAKVRHHQNPWDTYSKQFDTVLEQFESINSNDPIVEESILVFKELSSHTTEITKVSVDESETIVKDLGSSIFNIKKISSKEDISHVIHDLEKIETVLDTPKNLQNSFTQSIADISNKLTRTNIPVATEAGFLLEKKVDFAKSAKKWMDYNVLPEVIALWDYKAELFAFAKHSILNLKGSLVVEKNKENLSGSVIDLQSLKGIEETFNTNLAAQKKLSNVIDEKLKTQFLATSIYNQEEFLEVSLQSSFTHYTTDTNDRFTNWIGRFRGFFGNVNTAYDKVVSAKSNDVLDTAAECIYHRMFKEENAQYDMLFLNKNFLGDHFLATRTNYEAVFEKCLDHWGKGFHKSVLVVGDRHSGKSTFINKAVKNNLLKDVIVLVPDTTITFQGRKFNTTKNLKESLLEIKKSSYNSKPIVIIDDLEFWQDKEHSFLDNVRAALKFIESESDDILLIISISKLMQQHLDHRLSFSNSFTTHIDLSSSKSSEIFNAVRLRHGASHRTLVDENDELISPRQFEKLVFRLCKRFDNNLGEVLQAWTYGTNLTSDNKVVYKESTHYFPDFFTKEEVILLKYVLLYKIIDERTIKSFLGKRYTSGYESGLKRLANTKVLVRDQKGYLSLNAVVSSEVQKSLIYRGILK